MLMIWCFQSGHIFEESCAAKGACYRSEATGVDVFPTHSGGQVVHHDILLAARSLRRGC